MCPGSSDPFYVATYYIKWVTTSWTYSIFNLFDLYTLQLTEFRLHLIDTSGEQGRMKGEGGLAPLPPYLLSVEGAMGHNPILPITSLLSVRDLLVNLNKNTLTTGCSAFMEKIQSVGCVKTF